MNYDKATALIIALLAFMLGTALLSRLYPREENLFDQLEQPLPHYESTTR